MGMLQMTWQPSLLKLSKRKHGSPPLGLKNLGNTCYLNSVLQCLTYTPPLANFCLQCFHSSICDAGAGKAKKRDCPFCILEKRIARSLSIEAIYDVPAKINSCLRVYAEHFRGGRQEDAHEFLRYVIDACHNTCLRLKKFQLQQKVWSRNSNEGDVSGTGETVVKEIFGGALQSQVKCLSCGAESNKVDEIMDISLEIFHSSSLKECLQKFFQPEILEGNNKYKCESCKELVAARKQMLLLQAPNVLVIQLKRFEGIYGSKIDKPIAFDDYLVLSSYMSKLSQDHLPEYNLCGTIVHSGFSPDSGHYYAYIKDTIGHWYCCNDSSVTLSTLQEVLSERVYILFFSRTKQRPRSKTQGIVNGLRSDESKDPRASIKKLVSLDKPSSSRQDASCEMDSLTDGNRLRDKLSCVEKQTDLKVSVKHSDSCSLNSCPKSNGIHPPILPRSNGLEISAKAEEQSEGNCDGDRASNHVSSNVQQVFPNQCRNSSETATTHRADDPDGENVADLKSKCKLENGFAASVCSMEKKAESLLKDGNGNSVPSDEPQLMKEPPYSSCISNGENGYTVGKSVRRIPVASNGTINMHASSNGLKEDLQKRDVAVSNSSPSKRKTEDSGSCILLSRDDKSCAKVEAYKELMGRDATKVLRSCGWYEEVHNFMHAQKKLRQESGISVKIDSELKSFLISEAKKKFCSQVPNSLKASLYQGLESFGRGKEDPSGT